MLPELILDNESFDEIMDEARNMIVSLYPQWTDFNYHDPGITLIEMFSWLKESQQFFMDQIGEETRKKYLKLLGIRPLHKNSSVASVIVEAPDDITVLPGTKLWAGRTPFQSEKKKRLTGGDVHVCFYAGESGPERLILRDQMRGRSRLNLELFGTHPQGGECFYIGFRRGLPHNQELSIYLEFDGDWEVIRNPVDGPMPFPLASMELQYYGECGWKPAADFSDETQGAVITGSISFRLPDEMKEIDLWGQKGFFLRLALQRHSYDVCPVLQNISANVLQLRQAEQLAEGLDLAVEKGEREGEFFCTADTMLSLNGKNELYLLREHDCIRIADFTKNSDFDTGLSRFSFVVSENADQIRGARLLSYPEEAVEYRVLGMGTGFPFQEYDLNDPDVDYDSFRLMAGCDCGNPWIYKDWSKVDDFSRSGPEDRHYVLDAAKGVVRFGDCIHGLAPEGEITVVSYQRTLGRDGNAKARAIDRFDGMEPEDMPVCNWDNCRGGRDEETLEECFLRARRELKQPLTAVSDTDYENRVMQTPGLMLESCKVISAADMRQMKNAVDETEINIVVKPFAKGQEASLSACYRDNILSYLERYRMAGRRINLLSPQYILFEIYADIVILPHFVGARERVEQRVKTYFEEMGNQFGASFQYADFYGAVDLLPCVARINSLTVDAKGNGVSRSKDGTIKLPPNGVVRLGNAQYLFSAG